MSSFPTDEMTLRHLIVACTINEETGQTHLQDFLAMGAREKSRTQVQWSDPPVFEVEYADDAPMYSEHNVIVALAQELLDVKYDVAV